MLRKFIINSFFLSFALATACSGPTASGRSNSTSTVPECPLTASCGGNCAGFYLAAGESCPAGSTDCTNTPETTFSEQSSTMCFWTDGTKNVLVPPDTPLCDPNMTCPGNVDIATGDCQFDSHYDQQGACGAGTTKCTDAADSNPAVGPTEVCVDPTGQPQRVGG